MLYRAQGSLNDLRARTAAARQSMMLQTATKKAAEPIGCAAFCTNYATKLGAQEGTRTPTVLPPLGPEPSASTNFAHLGTAKKRRILKERKKMSIKKLSKTRKHDPHFERERAKYELPLAVARIHPADARGCREAGQLRSALRAARRAWPRIREFSAPPSGDGARSAADAQPQGLLHPAGAREPHRRPHRRARRRLRLPDPRRWRRGHLPRRQADVEGPAPRPCPSAASSGSTARGGQRASSSRCLERANSRVVGRVLIEHGIMLVVPENRRINQDILVTPEKKIKAKAGQVVVVEIIEQPNRHSQPIGRIVEVPRQLRRPGHGNRDCAEEARPAFRVFGAGRRGDEGAAGQGQEERVGGPRRPCARRRS